ncbi:MAG: CpaB family protein [Planctomycetota bacterium]|jgi:Flp pilus assembly protein CpaB
MAEESQGVQNRGLLLVVAVVLAIVVVIIYNLQLVRERKAAEGDMVSVLRYRRDLQAGEQITARDLEIASIETRYKKWLEDVVLSDEQDYAETRTVERNVRMGEFVLQSHLGGAEGERPAHGITKGMVTRTVEIDSVTSPGTILAVHDRINLIGVFEVSNRRRTYRIIADVRVLAVGGRGPTGTDLSGGETRTPRASRAYRSVTIEVSPDVSLLLNDVLTHIQGPIIAEVRNPGDKTFAANAGQILPPLDTAFVGKKRGGGPR